MTHTNKTGNWLSAAKKLAVSTMVGLGGLLAAQAASAAVIINIDTYLTGNPPNPGNVTVAQLTLTQNGDNVDAVLTNMIGSLGSVTTNAFITELEFSYDGEPPITPASFTNFGGTQLISQSAITIDPNGQNAGYNFHINFDYPTSNNDDRFVNGETTLFTILGVTEADFLTLVSGSGPDALALVHIQGTVNGGSLKYVGDGDGGNEVPEPGTVALLGLGLLGFAGARKRKQS